jgi:hypothetical protein
MLIHYKPDFKIFDFYIEVKGWWNEKSKLIRQLMAEQYPDILILYISEKEYKQLYTIYMDKISNWERR